MARADVISEDDANHIKILEKQSRENQLATILSELKLYTNTILNVLNKLNNNSRDDAVKNILVLINDLLLEVPDNKFVDSLLDLQEVDASLPFQPFLKYLTGSDPIVNVLCLYNLVILLVRANKRKIETDQEVLNKVFSFLSSGQLVGNFQEVNFQFIGIQLLQELLVPKQFKEAFKQHNLIANFKPINQLITMQVKRPNASNIQLLYYYLLTTWILSFNAEINRLIVHSYPELIGNLLIIAKDSIKLKIIRLCVSTLRNFISLAVSHHESFKVAKLVLFHDGLNTVKILSERKFASNGSDEELSNDLTFLYDHLSDVVNQKLTSFDEYLTELENPNLISWSSPTHKSEKFWNENAPKFKESSYKLVKRILDVISAPQQKDIVVVIMLNDLQFLIKQLGNELVEFINKEKHGHYKLLIMSFLESSANNELKYEALKTIQLLVGHNY